MLRSRPVTSTQILHIPETAPAAWLVLVHGTHGGTAREREVYNSGLPRMLNVTGRWSSHPTREVPVLVWRDRAAVDEAQAVCRKHRGDAVVVSSFGHSGMDLGKELTLFTASHVPALAGYLPYERTAAAKAEVARLKVLASAAFLVARSTADEQLAQRARELAPKAGAGAADYLTGKAGRAVALSIMEGKVAADAVVTREHLAAALEIAEAVIVVRLSSAGFG